MLQIDCHTHVFNVNFLPIAGIIQAATEVKTGTKMPSFICKLIEGYMHRRTDFPLKAFNVNHVSYSDFADMMGKDARSALTPVISLDKLFQKGVQDEIVSQSIIAYGDVPLKEIGLSDGEAREIGYYSDNTIQEVLSHEAGTKSFVLPNPIIALIIERVVAWALKKLYKHFLKSYVDWFMFMTRSHGEICQELMKTQVGVDLFIHHDMDMDSWYDLTPPRLAPYEAVQVNLMSTLAKESKGRMIPFYAYDPKKGIENLMVAIEKMGYLGVKFYPPSGYKPLGDTVFDATNRKLYAYCSNNQIPIFAHCNDHGMEAYKGAGKNSDPKYWAQVLNEYPDLTLCFGHAGGESGWFADDFNSEVEDYSLKVYKLCVKHKNVYCDFGYFPGILKAGGLEVLRRRLLFLFDQPIDGETKYDFSTKIMYGSDWHMLMQENGFQDYLTEFQKLFTEESHLVFARRFFFENAVKYLDLFRYAEYNKNHFLTPEAYNYLSQFILADQNSELLTR